MKSELDKLVETIIRSKVPLPTKPGQSFLKAPFRPRVYTIADFHAAHRTVQ